MSLPSIKTFKGGDCRFGFPQFKSLRANELRDSLDRILKDGADPKSYFVTAYGPKYGNVESTIKVIKEAIVLLDAKDLLGAATVLRAFYDAERDANRSCYVSASGYYLDLHGEVAVYQQCCR